MQENRENQLIQMLKVPLKKDKFLQVIRSHYIRQSPELNYQLLMANGFPLEEHSGDVYLTTNFEDYTNQTYCIVDIETNGGSEEKADIIELAAIKLKNHKIIDEFNTLIYNRFVPDFITKITNIDTSMLKDAPKQKDVLKQFKMFLTDSVFVAHNVNFDYKFIAHKMEYFGLGTLENRKLCTLDLAKQTIQSPKYSLQGLIETLNIKSDTFHRAYDDAINATKVLQECFKKIPTSVKTTEDLILFSKSQTDTKPNLFSYYEIA
ncbi:MAG: 3'-5' exonuclease [Campylobacterales bacterium]|nr:3'-5' exonuclease [Campylobacterales bacterium]